MTAHPFLATLGGVEAVCMASYSGGGYNNPAIPGLSTIVNGVQGAVQQSRANHQTTKHINQQHAAAMQQIGYQHQLGLERDLVNHHLGTTLQSMKNLHDQRMAYTNADLADRNAERAHGRGMQASDAQRAHEATMQQAQFGHAQTMRQGDMVHEAYMTNLNAGIEQRRETRQRTGERKSAQQQHDLAKDMVTHVAGTLAGIAGQGPVTGLTVPGGSISFGQPQPGAAQSGPKVNMPSWATTTLQSTAEGSLGAAPKKRRSRNPGATAGLQFSDPGAAPGAQDSGPRTPRTPL